MADEIKKNESEGSFWTFFEKKNLLDLGDQMGIKQLFGPLMTEKY